MTNREATMKAYNALHFNLPVIEDYGSKEQLEVQHNAINALDHALAQPEQEPVAWMVRDQVDGCRYPSALKNPAGSINGESQPLYTTPPKQWVGLHLDDMPETYAGDRSFLEGAKWAEAKLKEKNT